MSSIRSLAETDESPSQTEGESPHPDNAAISGEQPKGFDGEHGESQGLADLLAESDESEPDGESPKETPATGLIDLAEKLDMQPDDLYGLTVTMSDGKPMKIGELKDIAQKATDLESADLDLETRRQEQEAKFTRMHGELRELVAALPKSALTNEQFAKATQRYESRLTEARAAVDAAVPEWKDADVRKAERASIGEFLGDYGFDANYLETVLDPRSVTFIRDAWRLNKRVKDALAKVKRVSPAKRPASSAPAGRPKSSSKPAASTPIQQQYDALLDS